MVLAYYVLMPGFIRLGMLPYTAYMVAFSIPLGLLLIAALIGYWREKRPFTPQSFVNRFRYHRLNRGDWAWLIGIFALEMTIYVGLTQVSNWLIGSGWMPMPNLPAFTDPRQAQFSQALLEEATGGLSGNWFAFWLTLIALIINVVGEEFWWRGYILPRQEAAMGSRTWLIHGLLWDVFHLFKWWDLLNLLPLSLGLTYVVVRRKNNTLGMIIHFITNGVALIPIALGVLS